MPEQLQRGPDRRLGRSRRLTASGDFADAFAQGRSWAGRCMVLWLRQGPGAALRLGVVASRKVGGAVQRARAKRRLREVFRLHRPRMSGEADVVLVARAAILTASWEEVGAELRRLAARAGLLVNTCEGS